RGWRRSRPGRDAPSRTRGERRDLRTRLPRHRRRFVLPSSIRAATVSRVKGLQRFAALVALLCGACSRGAASDAGRTAASRPSILLVTLDTTRADVVAPEGSAELTPNLARLARQATRFS